MSAPTRFPNGITNRKNTDPAGNIGAVDPSAYHQYFNDFETFDTSDWVITLVQVGAGTPTQAVGDETGGVVVLTNDTADNDSTFVQSLGESFQFVSGKKLAFKCRLKVNEATESDIVIGLQETDTTPLAVDNGVYFIKDDGDTQIDFKTALTATETAYSNIGTLAADTYVELAFYYDGQSSVAVYIDGAHVQTATTTTLPTTELALSFGSQNGTTSAVALTIDYILVTTER